MWSSAGKWFIAGGDCSALIVTNGCTRLRVKDEQSARLPDVVAGFCSEAFRIQMRSLATGSDGLAEVSDEDLVTIVLPILGGDSRAAVGQKLELLRTGELRFGKKMVELTEDDVSHVQAQTRKSHCSAV